MTPTTPGRLPEHLRAALASGLCRQQPITTTTQPTIFYTDAGTAEHWTIPQLNNHQNRSQPIIIPSTDPDPVEQLVIQLQELYPQLTAHQIKLQAL